jgi:hypothetical protein
VYTGARCIQLTEEYGSLPFCPSVASTTQKGKRRLVRCRWSRPSRWTHIFSCLCDRTSPIALDVWRSPFLFVSRCYRVARDTRTFESLSFQHQQLKSFSIPLAVKLFLQTIVILHQTKHAYSRCHSRWSWSIAKNAVSLLIALGSWSLRIFYRIWGQRSHWNAAELWFEPIALTGTSLRALIVAKIMGKCTV